MVTIIILIIVLILALVIVPFTRQIVKDKEELAKTPINEKFQILIAKINDGLLDGKGEITLFDDDPRLMNLMSEDMRNMLIQFYYSTGNLTIYLNYKYLQKELKWSKQFSGLRNLTIFMQKDIANQFIEMSRKKIVEHQQNVGFSDVSMLSGVQNYTDSEDDPTEVVSSIYEDLSSSQKKSIVNLMYVIASSGGNDEERILHSVAFTQQILFLNVRWEDCKTQLTQFGKDKIYSDLSGIDHSSLDMIVIQCFHLVMELSTPPDVNPNMERTFFESFNKLGYPEDKVQEVIEKMIALSKMFGG